MSWQPDPSALQELITVLRDSTSSNSEVQRHMAEVSCFDEVSRSISADPCDVLIATGIVSKCTRIYRLFGPYHHSLSGRRGNNTIGSRSNPQEYAHPTRWNIRDRYSSFSLCEGSDFTRHVRSQSNSQTNSWNRDSQLDGSGRRWGMARRSRSVDEGDR
jgi:hypothetical protein